MSAAKLSDRIPDGLIKQMSKGGASISYVEWHAVADLLDERAPGWAVEIREVGMLCDRVFIRLAIIIDGVARENIGYEDEDSKGYGDQFSNSYAMAFKRAAAMHGVGRHLYDKDEKRARQEGGRAGPRPVPARQEGASSWACGEGKERILKALIDWLEENGVKRQTLGDTFERFSGQRDPKLMEPGDADKVIAELRQLQQVQKRK